MEPSPAEFSRRQFVQGTVVAGVAAGLPAALLADSPSPTGRPFNIFIKFLNSLGYDELAERIAELGFSGIEAVIRTKDGYILPENAAAELPKFNKALEKNGLKIAIVTTDILSADQQHADTLLRTLVDVGVPRYRLGFYRYDLKRPIVEQVTAIQPKLAKLAELNRQVGVAGLYQNHSGPDFFGGTIWDLFYVLKDHDPDELACVYDLRHAAVEAGESWPTLYSVMKPHIRAYSVKDAKWNGRRSEHVPLGEGMVDPAFYQSLAASDFDGPVTLHVEHVHHGNAEKQLAAVKRDFAVLREWMA